MVGDGHSLEFNKAFNRFAFPQLGRARYLHERHGQRAVDTVHVLLEVLLHVLKDEVEAARTVVEAAQASTHTPPARQEGQRKGEDCSLDTPPPVQCLEQPGWPPCRVRVCIALRTEDQSSLLRACQGGRSARWDAERVGRGPSQTRPVHPNTPGPHTQKAVLADGISNVHIDQLHDVLLVLQIC